MTTVAPEDVSDEEFEAVISSRGFQKMLLYQRLADGIEILQMHDSLYDSLLETIVEQHSEIDSPETVEEVFSLLNQEVTTYTEPFTGSETDNPQLPEVLVSALEEATPNQDTEGTEPEEAVREYLENRLVETDELNLKANEIASDLDLASTHVGGILGQWRNAESPPFAITASESASSGNVWTVTTAE
jgi:hypothetical protein